MTVHPVLKVMSMGMFLVQGDAHVVFIWRLLGCGLCGLGCGLYGLAALRQKVHLNICYLGHSWGAQGAIWDGLGRPCVPQGVQKYIPRDEN